MQALNYLNDKMLTHDNLNRALLRWRLKGKKIVFTNGVYDLVHRGHITLLSKAASLGDVLIVGLNSDESVRTLHKGPDRPFNGEDDRAFVLAAFQSVGAVIIFTETTPAALIEKIEPDVLVKGGDYNAAQTDPNAKDYIIGSDLQRDGGRETVVIPLETGYSTTSLADKMKNG